MTKNHRPYTYTDRTDVIERGNLADLFRGATDRVYTQMRDGSLRRVSPARPWRGKRERRQVIRERRIERIHAGQEIEFNRGLVTLFKQSLPQ